jgi:hypothetical protein
MVVVTNVDAASRRHKPRFPSISKYDDSVSSVNVPGIAPDSLLSRMYNSINAVITPISDGSEPVSLLVRRVKLCKAFNLLTSGGIEPVSALPCRISFFNAVNSLIAGGIVPVNGVA